MMKRMGFKKNTIMTIIFAVLCFSCIFATIIIGGNGETSLGGEYHFALASGTGVAAGTITLRTHTDTAEMAGYTKNGETYTKQTQAYVGDLLPTPTDITKTGATLKFLGWHKADGAEVATVQDGNNDLTANWKAEVTSGEGLKAAENKYVREIYIMNDILLDQTPAMTNVTINGGGGQTKDNVVFQALASVKIFGNNHTISAFITGTNSAGICNKNTSQYIMFFAGQSGTLEISDLTIYGGGKQAIAVCNSMATMTNCTVSRSGSNTLCGGAMVVSTSGKLKAKNCNFKRNVAKYGGAVLITTSSTALFENCVINENRNVVVDKACGGGAMEVQGGCKLYFVNSTLSNNQSTEIGGGVNGNYFAHLYIINSTITGNVSSAKSDNFQYGGGLGGNGVNIHVYNSIIENNYFFNTEKNIATPCDIGFYYEKDSKLDAHNSIIGAVYKSSNNITDNYTGNGKTNIKGNADGDFYRYDEIKLLNADGTIKATLPIEQAKSPIITDDKIYLFAGTSSALSGGAYIYFNGDDINNIRLGYQGKNDANIITAEGAIAPTAADKIDKFKNGVLRDQSQIVMGALYSIPDGESYAKITGKVSGQGTVDGYSIFSNYYLVGKDATFVAAALPGFAFEGYYDVTEALGGTVRNKYLSSNLSYTFKVVTSDDNMVLEARFVNETDRTIAFTTYGGTMPSGFTPTVEGQVYKKAYDGSWQASPPRPQYSDGGTFVKWYSDSTFQTEATFANGTIKNYYAKVTDSITYTFKDDTGTPITAASVSNPNAGTYTRNVGITFALPTLANYFFVGWQYADSAAVVSLGQTDTGAKAVVGVFKQRTISFAGLNGADPSAISPLKVTGQAQSISSATKVGFIFDGWSFTIKTTDYKIASTALQFTTEYANLMNVNNIENLVLTANWKEKAVVDFVVLTPQTYDYDPNGRAFAVNTGSQTGETEFAVQYFIGSAYSATKPTDVGAYKVQIYRAETNTYKEYTREIADGLVITPKALAMPTLSNTNYVYTGVAQTATLINFDNSTMTVTNNSQIGAGTYNTASNKAIKVSLQNASNYKWDNNTTADISIEWTIKQAQLAVANVTVTNKTYDGNTTATANIGTVTGIVDVDTNTTTLINVTATATFADASANVNKTVDITYQISGSKMENYIAPPNSNTVKATITPATITYTANNYSAVYNGAAHGIAVNKITTINRQTSTVTYCRTETGTYEATAPTFKDFTGGAQTVYFKITAPNHNDIKGSATVEIRKADVNVTNLALTAKTYGDIKNVVHTDFTKSAGSVSGVNDETNISGDFAFAFNASQGQLSSGNLLKASNNYSASYTFTSRNANYNGTSGNVDFKVNKATLTATFSNVDLTYNGKIQTIAVAINSKVGDKVLANITYTDTSNNATAVCNAKDYIATAALSGASVTENADVANYTLSGVTTKSFTIKPLDVTVTIADIQSGTANYTYDGSAKMTTATYTAMCNADSLNIALMYSKGVDEAHINAGVWTVLIASATVTGTAANYKIIPDTGTMVIDKAKLPTIETIASLVYTGMQQEPTIVINGVKNEVAQKLQKDTDFTISWSDSAFINAKTYNVTATGIGNYKDTSVQTYTITPATITYTANNYSAVYNGAAHGIAVTATTVDGVTPIISYSANDVDYTTTAIEYINYTNVAQTVYFKITAPNHSEITGSNTVEIRKVKLTVADTTVDSKTYNGDAIANAHLGTVTGIVGKDSGAISVSIVSATFNDANVARAGSVTVVYQLVGNGATINYIVPENSVINAKMSKAAAIINTEKVQLEYTYTGSLITVENGATLNHSETTLTYKNNTFINVQDGNGRQVAISAAATDNYNAAAVSVTLTVNKAIYAMTGVDFADASKVYNGKIQTLAISGTLPQGVTVTYSEGIANAGRKAITATFTGDTANYNAINSKTANLIITKKNLTITADSKSIIYNQIAPQPSVLYSGFILNESESNLTGSLTYVCNYKQGSSVGSYDIIPSGYTSDNYNIAFVSGKLIVNKATYDMTNAKWNYNGAFIYDTAVKSVAIIDNTLPTGVTAIYTNNSQLDAGDYIASVTFTYDTVNYNEPTFANCNWTISKAALPTIAEIASVVYSGQIQAPTVVIGGLLVDKDFTILWSDSALINAKTYNVTATGIGNYTGESTQTYEITRLIVPAPTAGSKVYTGSNLTSDIKETSLISVTANNGGIDAGEYDVVISLVNFANCKWEFGQDSQTRTLKFVIIQAENAITNLHLESWIYKGSANAPNCDSSFGEPIFTYSAQENSGYTSSVPSAIGVWFVKASVAETNNFKGAQAIKQFSIVAYTYKIAFDKGYEGDQTMPIQSRSCDDGLKLTPNNFQRVGYAFVGWKVAGGELVLPDGASGNICDGPCVMITLVAQWIRNVFTYEFFNDDLTLIFSKTANYGDTIEVPSSPVKADSAKCSYRFIGWDNPVPDTLACDLTFVAKFAVKTIYGDINQNTDGGEDNCDIEVSLPDNDKSVLTMTIKDITEKNIISNIDNVLKDTSIKNYGANRVLRVELLKDGQEINLDGKYTVRLKEKAHPDFDIKIVQVKGEEIVEIQYEREGDYIVFDTVSLGNIVVLEQNLDANLWPLVAANMILLLLELCYLIFHKRNSKERKNGKSRAKTYSFAFAPLGLLGAVNVIPMYLQILLAVQTVAVIVLALVVIIVFCKSRQKKEEEHVVLEANIEEEIAADIECESEIAPTTELTTPICELPAQEAVGKKESDYVIVDGKKVYVSFRRSFLSKLIQVDSEKQKYYETIKNHILGYKNVKSRISWSGDTFNSGREKLVRLSIRGKTLVMNVALQAEDIEQDRYHATYNDSAKYVDVPMQIKVKGPLKLKQSLELVDKVCEKHLLKFTANQTANYTLPYKSDETLIEEGQIKVVYGKKWFGSKEV